MADNAAPKYRVKFFDGPARGVTMEYDKERPEYTYFGWVYQATGKRDGDHWLYVRKRNQRDAVRLTRMIAMSTGSDPRLTPRRDPLVVIPRGRNAPCWCGSGKKYKKCHLILPVGGESDVRG